MKYLKEKICILTAILLIMSSVGTVFSSDYEGHWAATAISELVEAGIINGDGNGKIRPDDYLLRAEFVKIVNKAFGYSNMAAENFSDVSNDKWYAREFLIARAHGYILGDQNKMAHPESNISRNEICVILSRILNLPSGGALSFADKESIPDWAASHISALTASGYISGYADATFRGGAYAARAEAFHIIKKIIDSEKSKTQNPVNNMGDTSGMTSAPGISFGGGGGGGGGGVNNGVTTTPPSNTPVIKNLDDDENILNWSSISDASSYEIKLEYEGNTKIVTAPAGATTFDLSGVLMEIYSTTTNPEIEISISMRAMGSSFTSSYSQPAVHTATFPALPAPEAEYLSGTANGIRHGKITWNEDSNAGDYDVEFYINDVLTNVGFVSDKENRIARIADLTVAEGEDAYVLIKALSKDLSKYKNSVYTKVDVTVPVLEEYGIDPEAPVPQTGDGTKDNPYTISSAEHFLSIADKPAAHYKLIRNITLPKGGAKGTYTLFNLSGSLTTDGGYRSITVDIDNTGISSSSTTDPTGLFAIVSGSAEISNIILKGKVISSARRVGGIAGQSGDSVTIKNCINMAEITGRSEVGGIFGYASSLTFTTTDCVNFKKIVGTNVNVGGIAGYGTGVFERLQNHAAVEGVYSVGGLFGNPNYGMTDCFNTGAVKVTGATTIRAGGLAGDYNTASRATEIKRCYNTGSVTAAVASGLLGDFRTTGTLDIENCYNIGDVIAAEAYPCFQSSTALKSVSNVLYSSNDDAHDDGIEGTIPVLDLSDRENAYVKVLLENGFTILPEYGVYPVLVNNLPKTEDDFYSYDAVSDIEANISGGELQITWTLPGSARIESMNIVVTNNSELTIIADENLDKDAVSYTVSNLEAECFYGIKITVFYEDGGISGTASKEIKYTP